MGEVGRSGSSLHKQVLKSIQLASLGGSFLLEREEVEGGGERLLSLLPLSSGDLPLPSAMPGLQGDVVERER